MSKIVLNTENSLRQAVKAALSKAIEKGELTAAGDLPEINVETPADRAHGDYACNAAMACARVFRMAPRRIAEILLENLDLSGTYFEKAEIAGPGFMNFFLSRKFYSDILRDVLALGENYGRSDFGEGKKYMVEFVSANPTGPMHMGNARGGALGDCLAAVLDAAGYDVWREFYVNDAGNQIDKFALSLDIRYRQLFEGENAPELPEDSYHGADITERAEQFAEKYGRAYLEKSEEERRAALVAFALPLNIEKMKRDMEKYRIHYDCWFLESTLHNDGELQETIDILRNKGYTYEKDGALWYNAMRFGAEKDEVLVRQNGNPTYFAADIAYHRNKFLRGFTKCINVWGADHHGHVARMKGALSAVGYDPEGLDVVLMQLVRLMRDGVPEKMSKRTGKAIQLADLLDEVPVDAARFLFNLREASVPMDFDLGLAVQQDAQNPVYYVQYANARICSILKALARDGIEYRECTDEELAKLTATEETELLRHLAAFTGEIIAAAQDYDPARITRYVINLATLFHKFYNACRVKGEEDGLMHARLALCIAARTVIGNVLRMFKITAPETM
ncbi:MAG: arginine--tRNA ligase [Clostridia bacterium]|nr:arginine--tRNA ligase [Clostridia bacterium]